jgi:hypothetical protein
MTDFLVQIRIKNAHLWRAIKATGCKSVNAFGRKFNINPQHIGDFINMRLSPLRKSGEWRDLAYSISSATGVEPEELWPQYMRRQSLLRNTATFEVSADDLQQMALSSATPEYYLTAHELPKFLKTLNSRELTVIADTLDGETYRNIGQRLGVTHERARQILFKAEGKIRTAIRSDAREFAAKTGEVISR